MIECAIIACQGDIVTEEVKKDRDAPGILYGYVLQYINSNRFYKFSSISFMLMVILQDLMSTSAMS